jgi:DNA-binding CsgD family transcriptional regulator
LLALATVFQGDLARAVDLYDRAIALHRALDDRVALCSSLSVRAVAAGGGGSTLNISPTSPRAAQEALEGAEEALRTAHAIGFRAGESFASHAVAEAAFARGFYTRAVEVSRAGLQLAEEIAHEQWACSLHFVLGTLLGELGATSHAEQHLERSFELARSIGSLFWKRVVGGALVELLVEMGDCDAAERLAGELLDESERPRSIAARQVRFAQARVALARGQGERACSMLEALRIDGSTPTLDLLYAQTLLAIGRSAEAEDCLRSAIALAETCMQRAIAWRLRVFLPRVLEAKGEHIEAQRAREDAEALIAEIAADVPDELRAGFIDSAMRRMGTRPRRGLRDQAGLSPRERSVAVLIGEGLSNRAIAERLTLGERTVESHVSAILAKLRLTNRSQVAAWIARAHPYR